MALKGVGNRLHKGIHHIGGAPEPHLLLGGVDVHVHQGRLHLHVQEQGRMQSVGKPP